MTEDIIKSIQVTPFGTFHLQFTLDEKGGLKFHFTNQSDVTINRVNFNSMRISFEHNAKGGFTCNYFSCFKGGAFNKISDTARNKIVEFAKELGSSIIQERGDKIMQKLQQKSKVWHIEHLQSKIGQLTKELEEAKAELQLLEVNIG